LSKERLGALLIPQMEAPTMVTPLTPTPYGLTIRTNPRVRAEAGEIAVRLELTARDGSGQRLDLEAFLDPLRAKTLGMTLLDTAGKIP
jgi:hypothetical protein